MKLVLLGTSGYHPSDLRQTACCLIPEIGVMFDAGTAVYRLSEYLQTDRLDIFLSHAHLDHVVGLTYLPGNVPAEMLSRITVHGEPDKLEAIQEHLFANLLFPLPPSFRFAELTAATSLADGGTLHHFPLEHPGGSIGFRIEWPGRSLAYVTDTTARAGAAYVEHLRNVDLLVHEAYFTEEDPQLASTTGHSSILSAASVAAEAGVGRLVLVHIGPRNQQDTHARLSEARKVFSAIEIGTDRMELEI